LIVAALSLMSIVTGSRNAGAAPSEVDDLWCFLHKTDPKCVTTETTTTTTGKKNKDRTNDLEYIRKHDLNQYGQIMAQENDCESMRAARKQNTAKYRRFCAGPPPLQVTEYIIREQFATLPLPKGQLKHEPAWGALVNKKEIFYTTAQRERDYPITLLGHHVVLHATVSNYTWSWGDASKPTTTDNPGGPYPDFAVSHTYTAPATCPVSVTLTYTATYSVDGGPEQDVPGTATIAGTPADVHVVTAHSVLVAGGN